MAEYIELINNLRQEAEWEAYLQPHSANETPKLLSEAADVIEKLLKAVNFHKYNSEFWEDKYNTLADEKWIPVTKRLPEESQFVLAYGEKLFPNRHDGGTVYVTRRIEDYWSGLGRTKNITHWMPLPEPPKEE